MRGKWAGGEGGGMTRRARSKAERQAEEVLHSSGLTTASAPAG